MKRYGRGRHRPGVMNGLETKYHLHLQRLKELKEIDDFKFEAMKFRLADKTFYTPDFAVLKPDGFIEYHEVKGYWEDDARVKIKVAAEMHWFKFIGVTLTKGVWVFEYI